MIDYLEEVLTEEEDLRLQGRRAAVRPPERKGLPEPETGGTETREAPVREEGSVRPEREAEEGPEGALPPEEWDGPALPEPLRRSWLPPGEGRTGAAELLMQALSRTGRSLRALRGGAGVLTVALPREDGASAGGTDLEALDLAMQRDARRYDGAFQLY